MEKKSNDCDVLIVGAGQSGNTLARQLKLQNPDLRIINIDKKTNFDYWVGESSVEAWEDYMTRVLHLGPFMEKNFLQKHGLRMFFDNEKKNLSLSEMSEFGRSNYHAIPARNMDRALFDREMAKMNKELGIDVRLGVSIKNDKESIHIDSKKGHRIQTSDGEITCKYFIDASGKNSYFSKNYVGLDKTKRINSASYWCRFKGANWIDDMGDDEWRQRVRHTIRYNSTGHFMYKDYWFWLIPITDDIVSIGVEMDRDKVSEKIRNAEEFEAFCRKHKCLDELLGENVEALDFYGLAKLPQVANQFFSEERWFLTGMSAMFIDVMGSGTSRIIAEFNRLIGQLIKSDLEGNESRFQSELMHFNLYMKGLYEIHYRNLSHYDWYGSFDVWPNFFGAGLSKYFNSHLPNNITDLAEIKRTAHEHQDGCKCSFNKFKKDNLNSGFATQLNKLMRDFVSFLNKKKAYYASNEGQFFDSGFWEERNEITKKMYDKKRCLKKEHKVDQKTYKMFTERLVRRMCEIEGVKFDKTRFNRIFKPCWNEKQKLKDIFHGVAPQILKGKKKKTKSKKKESSKRKKSSYKKAA